MQQRSASSAAAPAGYYGIAASGVRAPLGTQRRPADPNDFPALSGNSSISGQPLTPGGSGSSYAQLAQAQAHAQAQGQGQGQAVSSANGNTVNTLPQPPPGLQGYTVGQAQAQVNGGGSVNGMMQHGVNGDAAGRSEDFPALGGLHGIGEMKDANGRPMQQQAKGNPSPMVPHNGSGPSPPPSTLPSHSQISHLQQNPSTSQQPGSSATNHLYPSEPPSGSSHPQWSHQPPQAQPSQARNTPQTQPQQLQHDPSVPLTKPAQQLVTSPVDKWGLAALLMLIRTGGRDDQLALGLGEDLANIGLDMNGSAPLYPTFIAPWAEPESLRGVYLEDEFRIPQCYNVNTPPVSSKIALFSDETLFYAFYSSPRDVLQMEVAAELYARQWRYHKELGVWLTKDPAAEPIEKGPNYERGTYIIFDPAVFSRVETQKDFTLSYEMLEDRPVISAQAQAGPGLPGMGSAGPNAGTSATQQTQGGTAAASNGAQGEPQAQPVPSSAAL